MGEDSEPVGTPSFAQRAGTTDSLGLPAFGDRHARSRAVGRALGALRASAYDTRGRLIHEVKGVFQGSQQVPDFDLAYTYDQGGNRLARVDAVAQKRVEYTYDYMDVYSAQNPNGFHTKNNRLMRSRQYDTGPSGSDVLESTSWYYYNCAGNVGRVVTNAAGTDVYTALRLDYANNEQTVTYLARESWTWNGQGTCASQGYAVSDLREFRYASGRARYMTRRLNPLDMQPETGTEVWSDFDDDEIYGDFVVADGVAERMASYEPGVGQVTLAGGVRYVHTDHLGTTRLMTNATGAPDGLREFAAFGERLSGPTPPERFGYVGAFGYQQHAEFPFLHVGARYYDPASGRFLQRNPIGIQGGRNVYAYARGRPSFYTDPSGLAPDWLKSKKTKAVGVLLCAAGAYEPWLALPGALLWGGEDLWDGTVEVIHDVGSLYQDVVDGIGKSVPSEENAWRDAFGG